MDLQNAIMKRFLRKLINLNIWGGRHTELRNLEKSLPDHLRGSKESREALKELVRSEFLIVKNLKYIVCLVLEHAQELLFLSHELK